MRRDIRGAKKPFRQQRSGFVRETERGGLRNFSELTPYRGIDSSILMPVQIRPDRGIRVQVFTTVDVTENRTSARHNHDGLLLEPISHLRKRMPDVPLVELSEGMHHIGVTGAGAIEGRVRARALISPETCSAVCDALAVIRNRAAPRATAG